MFLIRFLGFFKAIIGGIIGFLGLPGINVAVPLVAGTALLVYVLQHAEELRRSRSESFTLSSDRRTTQRRRRLGYTLYGVASVVYVGVIYAALGLPIARLCSLLGAQVTIGDAIGTVASIIIGVAILFIAICWVVSQYQPRKKW